MPIREWRFRISDILTSIALIEKYVAGMNYESFVADGKTVDAVVRRFEIIGEAAGNVPPDILQAHPEIAWRQMRDMRNVLIHGYFGVKSEIVWDTIQKNLTPLVPPLENLLKEKPEQ